MPSTEGLAALNSPYSANDREVGANWSTSETVGKEGKWKVTTTKHTKTKSSSARVGQPVERWKWQETSDIQTNVHRFANIQKNNLCNLRNLWDGPSSFCRGREQAAVPVFFPIIDAMVIDFPNR